MNFSVPVFALVAGAAIGYCCAPREAAPEILQDEDAPARTIEDKGDKASLAALRMRIKELEEALALANAFASAKEVTPADRENPEERRGRPGPRDWRADFERMKTEEPEKYAAITNRMARFRQMRLDRAQTKLDILQSFNTDAMGAEARDMHERLERAIAEREELESSISPEDNSDEEIRETIRAMMERDREIRELSGEVRMNLISGIVGELGYEGDDAKAIVDTFAGVIDATETSFGGPPGPPPGPPPGAGENRPRP